MIHPTINAALDRADAQRQRYEDAQTAAEEALTRYFESHLAELAKRFPKRRFRASSGMGSLSIDITPGPRPMYDHHPAGEYDWVWGIMTGGDSYWSFLWQPWEDILDEFQKRSGLEYVNFTRDITVCGALYKEPE